MDCINLRELNCDSDLESGNGACSSGNSVNCCKLSPVKVLTEKKVERKCGLEIVEKKLGKENHLTLEIYKNNYSRKNKLIQQSLNKTSAKKPPRPPRGISLDAADQKLIKEIAELAMLKRARADRMKAMKAMKKMKTAKARTPSNWNLLAMLFTILFCLAILFQGLSTRNSSAGYYGSPDSEGGFIFVDHQQNPTASDIDLTT